MSPATAERTPEGSPGANSPSDERQPPPLKHDSEALVPDFESDEDTLSVVSNLDVGSRSSQTSLASVNNVAATAALPDSTKPQPPGDDKKTQ
ncbi:hypothetical protein MRX96_056664 [Rhipicephalus microplus]